MNTSDMYFTISVLSFFSAIALIYIIGYLMSSNDKTPEVLENKKVRGAYSLNFVGTRLIGWRILTEDQMKYYGFIINPQQKEFYNRYGPDLKGIGRKEKDIFPRFKTKFISLGIPFVPLITYVVFNEHQVTVDKGKFNAIPVKMLWNQAFGILALTYSIMWIIIAFLAYVIMLEY